MKSPLRILYLEDDPNDAALVQSTLNVRGISCTTNRVQDCDSFVAALQHGDIDLILSDFSLPAFDGLSALEIAQAEKPDLPFIFVSGTLGEEMAIDSLNNGATDYVLKHHLGRLAPAVSRAMKEVEERGKRRRLEAQFIEGQKMEVIGQLAGGVAHDFNNILSVIMGYSELLALDIEPGSPLRKFTDQIQHASLCAAALTRQLLVFSRKETVQPVVLDLNRVIKEQEPMLLRLIDAGIEMKLLPGKQIGYVEADSGYLGQILMNLVVNARDAMPTGGKLTIATADVTLDENNMSGCPGAIPGDYVMLSVTDTGSGMTDEVKAHLFEAFFTTKASGKGTGLGLATCQTIAQLSGGLIDVSSELDKGTTFKVYFPRINQSLDVMPVPAPTGPLPRGTETLLVVEDDLSVRHLACVVLEAQGYEVRWATDGRDALRAVREHRGSPISLVLTDVIMPLMGGKVMADSLRANYPDLKILFTSGYTDDAISSHGVLEKEIEFLHKPYTPTNLIRKVREVLDKAVVPQPLPLEVGQDI